MATNLFFPMHFPDLDSFNFDCGRTVDIYLCLMNQNNIFEWFATILMSCFLLYFQKWFCSSSSRSRRDGWMDLRSTISQKQILGRSESTLDRLDDKRLDLLFVSNGKNINQTRHFEILDRNKNQKNVVTNSIFIFYPWFYPLDSFNQGRTGLIQDTHIEGKEAQQTTIGF